jgi:hypothetical protein
MTARRPALRVRKRARVGAPEGAVLPKKQVLHGKFIGRCARRQEKALVRRDRGEAGGARDSKRMLEQWPAIDLA